MSQLTVPRGEFLVWPMLLNYSRDECFQILRRLELEAYSKVVSVFRAQGSLTGTKRKVLYKLQRLLSITTDRHKAEVRRALNDEELITISEAACGKEVYEEWISEGKRIAPVLHRPSAKTAYIAEANRAAFSQLCENYSTPPPCETAYLSLSPDQITTDPRSESPAVENKVVTKTYSSKGTQTIKSSGETSSPIPFAGGDSHETDNIPRVGYEVTCETENLSLPSEMLNGHVKQRAPFVLEPKNTVRSGRDAIEGQSESFPNHLTSESARVSLSAQLNSAHSAPSTESLLTFGKLTDLMQTMENKHGPTELTSMGSQLSRKRSLSTSPNAAESLTVPSKLLSLVHAPSTLTTAARRPVQSQLMQNNSQSETAMINPATVQVLPKTTETLSSNYSTVQRVQPKPTHSVIGLHSSSTNRPHSQLVLQMCRPASETLSTVDPTTGSSRSNNAVIIPPRLVQANTVSRTYPGMQVPASSISFKSPLIGSRAQRCVPSSVNDSGVDSTQRVGGTNRIPTAMNTVVLSTASSFTAELPRPSISMSHVPSIQSIAASPFKSNSVAVFNTPNNHFSCGLPNNPAPCASMDSTPGQSSLAARRLVSSAQPLIVPGLSVASNVVQNATSTSSNNVIVFQRALSARKPSNTCPTPIKLAPATPCVTPSTSTPTTPIMPGAPGNRQIRILGLSSNLPIGSSSVLNPASSSAGIVSVAPVNRATPEILSSPPTGTISTPTNPSDLEKSQGDVISNLLSRASRLGSMLEVDLDADDYMAQTTQLEADTCHSVGSCQSSDPATTQAAFSTLLGSTSQMETSATQQQLPEPCAFAVPSHLSSTESEASLCANRIMNRVVSSLHPVDSPTSINSEIELSVASSTPTIDRDCFDTPIEVPSNKKIDQLKAILGLTTHGASCTESGGEQTVESSKGFMMTSRYYPPSFDQPSSSTSEHWIIDRPSLTGYVIPEPKRARLSPAVSEALDLASTPSGGHRVPEHCDWQSDVEAVFEHLTHVSTLFIQVAGCGQTEWTDRRGDLLNNEQNLVNPLRVIRQWAACIPDLSTNSNQMKESIHKLHIHSITQLTNFLDALLLVLYRDGEVSPQWSTLRVEEQKRIVLSLSISLQCLCNLLSASKTLNQLIPSRLQALLSVLVTGRRTRLLLGQSDCPLSISGSAHGNRVLSYAAILYYSVLLHLEFIHDGLETGTLELIAHKLIVDPVVFRSVIFHCSRPVSNDDNAEVQSQLHYRLLLSKLADILSVYKLQTLCVHDAGDLRTPEEELEMSVHATGLVLIFRSNESNFTTNPGVLDATEPRLVVQTIRSCLAFYGLTAIGCGSPIDRFQRLLIIFDHQCTSWIAALLHLMETNPSESEILHSEPTESAFPFAVLRGVVHILSESVFSDLSNRKNLALFLESSGESVEQFWNRACDLIILLNTSSQWLDRLFPSPVQPEQRRAVNGSTCTVHPSRMTRKWAS
ncbi:BRCA2-interacting transcriptional repressor EMSY [Fasciola gigantica]|uniref:BRCA2-interacting transcriptional repressor EMSY n=1 Tax=Fasciola gigantica TaxID=46835 RepID=A0A504YAY7_FASGI|nr:BRCA2-interacting transcriptional repressor EMSY [Fasciola gigantica]